MNNDLRPINTIPNFKRFCMTIGELPTSYLETMTYYEMLVWFTEYMKNTIIPTINNNGLATQELQDKYIELKSYVDNYFTNLDVQQEINNKLDEMVSDGTFDTIINKTLFNQINEQIEAITYYDLPHGTAEEIETFINERIGIGHVFRASGKYYIDRALNIYPNKLYDFEGNTSETPYLGQPRTNTIKIQGSGSEDTIFIATNENAIFAPQLPQGETPNANLNFEFSDLSFVGDNHQNTPFIIPRDNAKVFRLRFTNCNFNLWEYGFYFNAYQNNTQNYSRNRFVTFINCYLTQNNIGCYISQDNVEFYSCYIQNNNNKGLIIDGSSVVSYIGGKIQYNGQNNVANENGNQVIIKQGSQSINFYGVYFEPTFSGDTVRNRNTSPILLTTSQNNPNATRLLGVQFSGCRINAHESESLIYIDSGVRCQDINLGDFVITQIRFNNNYELVKINDNAISVKNITFNGVDYNCYNESGSEVNDNSSNITSFANAKNIVNHSKYGLCSTPTNNGIGKIIGGYVNSDASQKYFNSDEYNVVKEEVGTYLITLNSTNIGTGNKTYFPVIANAHNSSVLLNVMVQAVSANSFRIKIRRIDNNQFIDNTFSFIAFLYC